MIKPTLAEDIESVKRYYGFVVESEIADEIDAACDRIARTLELGIMQNQCSCDLQDYRCDYCELQDDYAEVVREQEEKRHE